MHSCRVQLSDRAFERIHVRPHAQNVPDNSWLVSKTLSWSNYGPFMQASVAGRGWGRENATGVRALRKITPTVPSSVAAARRAQLQVPPAMSQLLQDAKESVHVRLQAAFLAQYSTDAQPVWCSPLQSVGGALAGRRPV